MAYTLPKLDYAYDALEPHIDAQTMEIHHTKHHQAYIDKVNAALEGTEFADKDIKDVLTSVDKLPEDKRQTVINNGGGYLNHKLFWKMIGPDSSGKPEGELAEKINSTFGSFDDFKKKFEAAATGQFGSGWAWLVVDESGELAVTSTANQDSPVSKGQSPILGVDVWEHAYYLKYQNKRAAYLEAFWNVVNWDAVSEFYTKCK